MAQIDVDMANAIDFGGKALAALAGFGLADVVLFEGAITPEFIKPLVGWIVCLGSAVVLWRLVKP